MSLKKGFILMPRQPKTARFQLTVTDEERDEIDQWAAEHGISSSAEALRQLVFIGLTAAAQADKVEQQMHTALSLKRRAAREVLGHRERIKTADPETIGPLQEKAFAASAELLSDFSTCVSDMSVLAARAISGAKAARKSINPETAFRAFDDPETEEREIENIRQQLAGIKALNAKVRRE